MGVDVFPQVFVERAQGGAFAPWSLKTGKAVKKSQRLAVRQDLGDRAYEALMLACRAACPDGAEFCAAHEAEFAGFERRARPEEFEDEDAYDPADWYGAGALTVDELRALAGGPAPDMEDAAEAWTEAREELRRWAEAVAEGGGSRVVYWFEVT